MTRDEMIDKVIRRNGFENKWTIWFCELCEDEALSDGVLENAMICALTMPIMGAKEDE